MINRMKVPFTILQAALTTVSLFVMCACLAVDCAVLYLNPKGADQRLFAFNLIMSFAALVLSLFFVFKPSLTGFVSKKSFAYENPLPALSAVRTYVCFISLDAAAVLGLMIFGTVYSENAVKYIFITAPSIFAVGAVKYVYDLRKIGVDNEDDLS